MLIYSSAFFATTKTFADDDYYQALEYAERANKIAALRVVERALQKYPGDYQLTIARARLEFRLMRYQAAEQSYRTAAAVSDGAIEARVGLGWSLLRQSRCAAAVHELEAVLSHTENASARRGIEQCQRQPDVHGSVWLTGGGAAFIDHPWKRRFGDATIGASLQPAAALTLGIAYHYLRVAATDRRVAPVDQHELYAQAGVSTARHVVQLQGAMVWSADPAADASLHVGMSNRYLTQTSLLEEVALEVVLSRYPDLWVGRVAGSIRFVSGSWSITPGIAASRAQEQILTAGSLSFAKSFGALMLWAAGKLGPEYRAAYLTQFALLNSEDRSAWSVSAGLRVALHARWVLLASYVFLRMHTPDDLPASMHLSNVGIIYNF